MLLPVGRPMSSIAAGYLAPIAVFPVLGAFFGLLAMLCGWLALKAIKENPTLSGRGRAWRSRRCENIASPAPQ